MKAQDAVLKLYNSGIEISKIQNVSVSECWVKKEN